MDFKAIEITVQGRVQGVGFRAATQRKAASLGLVGWVKNRDDGAVQVFAQGKPESVQALIQWCHQGPTSSEVKNVATQTTVVDLKLQAFEVRR